MTKRVISCTLCFDNTCLRVRRILHFCTWNVFCFTIISLRELKFVWDKFKKGERKIYTKQSSRKIPGGRRLRRRESFRGGVLLWIKTCLSFRTLILDREQTIQPRMLRVSRQPSQATPAACHLRSPTQIHAALSPRYNPPSQTFTAFCVAFRRGPRGEDNKEQREQTRERRRNEVSEARRGARRTLFLREAA